MGPAFCPTQAALIARGKLGGCIASLESFIQFCPDLQCRWTAECRRLLVHPLPPIPPILLIPLIWMMRRLAACLGSATSRPYVHMLICACFGLAAAPGAPCIQLPHAISAGPWSLRGAGWELVPIIWIALRHSGPRYGGPCWLASYAVTSTYSMVAAYPARSEPGFALRRPAVCRADQDGSSRTCDGPGSRGHIDIVLGQGEVRLFPFSRPGRFSLASLDSTSGVPWSFLNSNLRCFRLTPVCHLTLPSLWVCIYVAVTSWWQDIYSPLPSSRLLTFL
ncbi:hypothetical protein BO78DRAFT_29275 [Aspergillus sclerotiicarbonarius CBS 121057]|uniref:Uncharacterized protein n=1 Tax=Aspergillus sclerotiicarbonarius (strain CBS 121057 / IBT 28362) TaxID=1448318 RepID=A0A319DXQ1_ASPSB|nr:hypothetical protein BO78DRAFT_29275 [Aspergillus sclerotiicarbonarius CBS 121057]